MSKKHKLGIFVSLLLTLVVFSALFYFIDPVEIVEKIGVQNSYLVMFIVALIGGVSSFTSASYLAVLFTFSQGGANPILLGTFAGIGIFIGDVFFYHLGLYGEKLLKGRADEYATKLQVWMSKKSDKTVMLISYIYIGFTPLPNDVLMIALSVGKVKFKKIVLPILFGSIQLGIILSFLFSKGFLGNLVN